jgi:hypothetical protein
VGLRSRNARSRLASEGPKREAPAAQVELSVRGRVHGSHGSTGEKFPRRGLARQGKNLELIGAFQPQGHF